MREAMRAPVAAMVLINVGGIVGFMVAMQVYCRMIRPYLRLYVDSHESA